MIKLQILSSTLDYYLLARRVNSNRVFVDMRTISVKEQEQERWEGSALPLLRAVRANIPQNTIFVRVSESSVSILLISLAVATEI